MNNPRLLTVLFASALAGHAICASAQSAVVMSPEELFAAAENHSRQLRPSFSSEEVARQDVRVAKAGRLPDINANLSLNYIGDGFTTRRDLSDYQKAPIPHFGSGLSINVSQPVYTGGAITAGIEMAEHRLTASRFATELQRDNIRFNLVGDYLDIYKYMNLREVVDKNISQARTVLAEMTARHEHGTALQNDITRYELLVSNLELQLTRINNTIDILNHNLVTIAGFPADITVLPDTTILSKALPMKQESEWQGEASASSPAIRLAESSRDISHTSERIAKAERLPKISLQAGWNIDGPILVEIPPINRNLSYWYVGVGVSYNISSLYKTDKTIARSHAASIHANDELAAVRENVEMGMRADYVRYLESYEDLKTRQKSVELAERNYNITTTRYSADMALLTDLLDAANSKLDAEQKLIDARINIIYYYYKLLFTSGKI